eukprot:365006-Chlamydomonas_euryale.AAC.9
MSLCTAHAHVGCQLWALRWMAMTDPTTPPAAAGGTERARPAATIDHQLPADLASRLAHARMAL